MSRNETIAHESARKHVTGQAVYVDDIPVSDQLLVGRVVYSPHAHARIISIDLENARRVKGVHAVLCHRDIPGHNQMGPVIKDEVCLAEGEVYCVGQAVVLIAAETEEQCLEGERALKIKYEPLEAITTLEEAIQRNSLLGPPAFIRRGDVETGLASSAHRIEGVLHTGAQEHWYLESQVCLCIPGEETEINVHSSTQHPSETQALIAEVLGLKRTDVVVEVRRMGGAFGGKETQANHTACWAALLCSATGRPVKIRLFRDDDMKITGKRHRFLSRYEAGFDEHGQLLAVRMELNADGGCAADLSFAILQRAMLHADNAYHIHHIDVTGKVYRTNLPSNTAFRGFGGPQGMAVIEAIVDRVARVLGKDSLEIRKRNFYRDGDTTHYGQMIEQCRLETIVSQLEISAEYGRRREAIKQFNDRNEFWKRGMALTPVKFGISFTTSFLNQAGALVLIYRDGTILVNHGGTEMGQGLHTKMQLVAATEFGVPVEMVKVNATNTSKVPNTSATAASAGADLNGMAVKNAADILKSRIAEEMAHVFSESNQSTPTRSSDIRFEGGRIYDEKNRERSMTFAAAVPLMHVRQVSLSATGFYKTPDIGWDKEKGTGNPFHYFAYGMASTEVLVDTLTGAHTVLRTDILHDVGDSLNVRLDIGQVEGGYVQGLGWVTTEEVKWDEKGNLLTHSPDTYKIPTVQDIPKDFRTNLLRGAPNPNTIHRSKAVAEPPLMLALSAWLAIKDAISAVGDHTLEPEFSLPATNEVIVLSIDELKRRAATASGKVNSVRG